ncbi:MAG: hypothetical protein ABIJ59_15725 [Pseudomonadota bacterium]
MKNDIKIEPCLIEAIGRIDDYITKATGVKPEQEEIANALTRYFVLKEIGEFVVMSRQEKK